MNEIDAIFRECVARATNMVSTKLAATDRTQATLIFQIAKLYFESVKEVREGGGAERG